MKNVNDLLKVYFKKINSFIDLNEEIIGRVGGDNFIAIIKDENINSFLSNLKEVHLILPNLKKQNFKLSARAGVFKISEKDAITSIIEGASTALGFSKEAKGIDVVRFNEDMLKKVIHEKRVLIDFPSSLNNGEFVVYYQPKVDSSSNMLVGAEALIRWIKDGKVIPPLQFIPIFEKRGEICLLDFYVLEKVCKDIRNWLDKGLEPVRVSVNFSKEHFSDNFLDDSIISILNKYSIDPKYIEIELLESSNYEDNRDLIKLINNLKNKNISISIDDFGKGYSSLSTIRTLNSDIIKIDKSFIDMIEDGKEIDKIMLKNIIKLIKDLELDIIAEGVETFNQVEFLQELGCNIVQGYFFDKPLSCDDFENKLRNKKY